jgi:CTD nuclear envelope phosphatase 1
VLVLDLDETLLLTTKVDVTFRPHIYQFLQECRMLVDEIVLFTAGTQEYADMMLQYLDPNRMYFSRRYYRQHCHIVNGLVVKDMNVVSPGLVDKILFIDDTPSTFMLQPNLAILVPKFNGDPGDDVLLQLISMVRDYFIPVEPNPSLPRSVV